MSVDYFPITVSCCVFSAGESPTDHAGVLETHVSMFTDFSN